MCIFIILLYCTHTMMDGWRMLDGIYEAIGNGGWGGMMVANDVIGHGKG